MAHLTLTTAAVCGAGVMGAQIAAHLANAGLRVYLYDLPAKEAKQPKPSAIAIKNLAKIDPAPLGSKALSQRIIACDYEHDLEHLKPCQIIVEAIAEQIEIKTKLYNTIAPYIDASTIVASNTSGLSIQALAESLPKSIQPNFCGVHFFNPPRYLTLVELIPSSYTNAHLLDQLETFCTQHLGKNCIHAQDTPNFIANRIGVFGLILACHFTETLNLGCDTVDQLTGKRIGRAKSATFRTLDLVGLDVLHHVIGSMDQRLKDDPWAIYYKTPAWIQSLIDAGSLGQKTKRGVYVKSDSGLQVWDIKTHAYRDVDKTMSEEVKTILKEKDPTKRFTSLKECTDPQAQFIWQCFINLWHYCAVCLEDIAYSTREVDLAMRNGFGWDEGPFETWQNIGWQTVTEWIEQAIASGNTLAPVALPDWVKTAGAAYKNHHAFSPKENTHVASTDLPVYQRQLVKLDCVGASVKQHTIFETDAVKLWHTGDDSAILSFKTKMSVISSGVLEGIEQALDVVAKDYANLIIWQPGEHFSAGADLMGFAEAFLMEGAQALEPGLRLFQDALRKVRYAPFPVIAATQGFVLGGGCELAMHCDRVVAAYESYIGLVEVGVGILPGAGGCKEMALRASQFKDPMKAMEEYYKNIAMAIPAKSAQQALEMGYLRSSDVIIMHANELLYVAKAQAAAMTASSYQPPVAPHIPILGEPAIANIQMLLTNMRVGNQISEHDELIATKVAEVICGGRLPAGSIVDEDWFYRLEREAFLELVDHPKSQERVQHLLETGKPLRN